MSIITKKFYNIFWQYKSCQNLFLLSKEELLESFSLGSHDNKFIYTSNRIIISNALERNHIIDTIKFRTEDYNIEIEDSLEKRIVYFKPILEDIFNQRFKKSVEKLVDDFEKNGLRLVFKTIIQLADENKREQNVLKILKKYGFIGKNLKSYKDVELYLENSFKFKKNKNLINDKTINNFFEGLKYIKEIYVNQSYKKLYTTNQVLLNTLNSDDNFESRLKLFNHLFDSDILKSSTEDAFIECSNCPPSTYKGVFQLKLNPNKLEDLKCPVCKEELTYFVPYELHEEIYKIVKDRDGLLLNALVNKLESKNINVNLNKMFLGDIEVDCCFIFKKVFYVVETKMYKLNTTEDKLSSKIKKHFGKLNKDVKRIIDQEVIDMSSISHLQPILLVNVTNNKLIRKVANELDSNEATNPHNIIISNLEMLRI